jgi:hypothetical protein
MAVEPLLQKLTADEFENWLPAVSVLRRAKEHLPGHIASVNAISPYLRSGLIRTGAARHVIEGASESARGVIEIEKVRWGTVKNDLANLYDFWRSGTLTVRHGGNLLTYFDVRFDPDGVAELMAAIAPSQAASPPSPVAEEPKGKPVPEPELKAWHALYLKIYGNGLPLPHAVKSAQGFFQGKSASRDRVHALFEGRTAGRKPTPSK